MSIMETCSGWDKYCSKVIWASPEFDKQKDANRISLEGKEGFCSFFLPFLTTLELEVRLNNSEEHSLKLKLRTREMNGNLWIKETLIFYETKVILRRKKESELFPDFSKWKFQRESLREREIRNNLVYASPPKFWVMKTQPSLRSHNFILSTYNTFILICLIWILSKGRNLRSFNDSIMKYWAKLSSFHEKWRNSFRFAQYRSNLSSTA